MIIFDKNLPVEVSNFPNILSQALVNTRIEMRSSGISLDMSPIDGSFILMPDGVIAGHFVWIPLFDHNIRVQIFARHKLTDCFQIMVTFTYFVLEIINGRTFSDEWLQKLPEIIKQGGLKEIPLNPSLGALISLANSLNDQKIEKIDSSMDSKKIKSGRPGLELEEKIYRLAKAQEAEEIRQENIRMTWKEIAKEIKWNHGIIDRSQIKLLSYARYELKRLQESDPEDLLKKVSEFRGKETKIT